MPVIEGRSLVKTYESGGRTITALDDVDLAVDAGDVVVVMGPSGSGKTTLLHLLGLLDQPTEGSVNLRGDTVSDRSDGERTRIRRTEMGFVFQHYHLVPTLTAVENVELPRLFDEADAGRERARSLLGEVGLADRTAHTPGELSGGQKQRVAIARSLMNDPSVLLADEPTGNLDRQTGSTILDKMSELADQGLAIVAATHDPLVAEAADRVVELRDGVVQ